MATLPKGHKLLGDANDGEGSQPGQSYHHVKVTMSRRGSVYRCRVLETWGSLRQCCHKEEHGRNEVIGRGYSVNSAAAAATNYARAADINEAFFAKALSQASDEALDEDMAAASVKTQ